MHRFLSTSLKNPICTISDKKEIHHIKNVLRLKKGQEVYLFDGQGTEAQCNIIKISNTSVKFKILKKIKNLEKKTHIVLACAIPKKSKFESIIEKCTELGVDEIIPLNTKRTEVKILEKNLNKKMNRFKEISINASKQSKRNILPIIHPIATLKTALNQLDDTSIGFIGWLESQKKEIKDLVTQELKLKSRIIFFIGPEGDFTPEEISLATEAGCIPISLGKTTLKVDTAAISVIAFSNFIINT